MKEKETQAFAPNLFNSAKKKLMYSVFQAKTAMVVAWGG